MKAEIYIICSNRGDGQLPDPAKACWERMFFSIENAERKLAEVIKEVSQYYGIYKATVEITERVETH